MPEKALSPDQEMEVLDRYDAGESSLQLGDDFEVNPETMRSHFLRGYFDGDGGAWVGDWTGSPQTSVSIAGNEDFLLEVRHYLAEQAGTSLVKLSDTRTPWLKNLQYCGNGNARKIYSVLYADASVFLPRKKEAFEEVAVQ